MMKRHDRSRKRGPKSPLVVFGLACLLFSGTRAAPARYFPQICDDAPTVVFAAHGGGPFGCLFTERAFISGFRVENATLASEIKFTTQYYGNIEVSFAPSDNPIYSYTVSQISEGTHIHSIDAKNETLGLDVLEVEFSGASGPGCNGNTAIEVLDAMMELPNGELVPMNRIDGGIFFTSSDVLQAYVRGQVYYADGITKAYGAIIETVKINGISARKMTVFRETLGTYTQRIQDDVLGASATIEIRTCLPDACGVCTETVAIQYVNPGWPDHPQLGQPVVHDFILPIPPPIQNPRSDINQDNKIDAEDLIILLEDWGKVSGG